MHHPDAHNHYHSVTALHGLEHPDLVEQDLHSLELIPERHIVIDKELHAVCSIYMFESLSANVTTKSQYVQQSDRCNRQQ